MRKAVLTEQQQAARARNPVMDLLARQLIVPKIFFEAPWPNKKNRIDVLAIDRSGTGDVHAVEIKVGTGALNDLRSVIQNLSRIPAHFKYLALFGNQNYRVDTRILYAPDGMGRIGVIQMREDDSGNLSADYEVRPERFGLDSSVFKMIDRFTSSHYANKEVRP